MLGLGMYKNVTLRARTANGIPSWVLLGPDGQRIAAFDAFAHTLRNDPKNTRDAYCRHVAQFFDYLIEVSALSSTGLRLTKLELTEAIEAYGDYLRFGTAAGSQIACAVAAQLPPGANAGSSLIPKIAAIRRFLRLSEAVRKEMEEVSRKRSGNTSAVDGAPLFPELGQRRLLSPAEARAIQANSMIAGVIAGGPKYIDALILNDRQEGSSFDVNRAFPYGKVMDLIAAMPTYRDKAQYALLAACGCRTHEALQILTEDIDMADGTLRLINPATRPSHQSYRALSPADRAKLAWKGRTTQLTLLIEPYASVFFESLQKYLEIEHIPHGRHDFLFQYNNGAERGMPYFLSDPSTRLERFQRASKAIGACLPRGTGPHSLRHMYGTYLLNYFPRANGDYGLPAPMVQQLMGHAQLTSTMKYAKFDQDLLKLEIQNANRVLFRSGTPKKLLELKLEALESQLARLRLQMKQEGLSVD
jgi:integrase